MTLISAYIDLFIRGEMSGGMSGYPFARTSTSVCTNSLCLSAHSTDIPFSS